jgi:hypothetical protein
MHGTRLNTEGHAVFVLLHIPASYYWPNLSACHTERRMTKREGREVATIADDI